jgi:hypothetical protein
MIVLLEIDGNPHSKNYLSRVFAQSYGLVDGQLVEVGVEFPEWTSVLIPGCEKCMFTAR